MNKKTDIQQPQGFVRKYDLAFKYFPNAPSKKAATDNLTRAINRCRPLKHELIKLNCKPHEWNYSPKQVELIYEYLGEP